MISPRQASVLLVGTRPSLMAVPGGVGLAAAKAKTVFDDVIVRDDSALGP